MATFFSFLFPILFLCFICGKRVGPESIVLFLLFVIFFFSSIKVSLFSYGGFDSISIRDAFFSPLSSVLPDSFTC